MRRQRERRTWVGERTERLKGNMIRYWVGEDRKKQKLNPEASRMNGNRQLWEVGGRGIL